MHNNIPKEKVPSFRIKNEEELLLFLHSEKFKFFKEYFRARYALPEDGFPNEKTAAQYLTKEEAFAIFEAMDGALAKCRLPVHYKKALYKNIVFNEVWVPPRNFIIRVSPPVKVDRDTGKILKYAKEIDLVTFKALDTEEQKLAIKQLKSFWKKYFPPHLTKRTNLRDRDIKKKHLLIEKMEKRKMKETVEEDSYLALVRKQSGESVYRDTKRKNPGMTHRKGDKSTSKNVAEELLGTKKKAGVARTAYSRLKKKMEE